MKKVAAISLFVLLVVGPASVWAAALDAACAGSHHGSTMQEMDDCHVASCCVVSASARHSGSAPEQLKRSTSTAFEALVSHHVTSGEVLGFDGRHRGDPLPVGSQTTPILRR